MTESLGETFFDDFYAEGGDDPWGFASRWYEQRKRSLLLAALPRRHFSRAFEPGCANGVLTVELAGRCAEVVSTDIARSPLTDAGRRLMGSDHVTFSQASIPDGWPPGRFDLIVLSEVGYYCNRADLDRVVALAAGALTEDGVLVGCHWRHFVSAYPLTGDQVHDVLRRTPGLRRLGGYDDEDFLLDVLVPTSTRSVGAAEGLA